MITKCPICKKNKNSVGPKYIHQSKVVDPRFNNPIQTVYTKVMCNDCLEKFKKGEIEIS